MPSTGQEMLAAARLEIQTLAPQLGAELAETAPNLTIAASRPDFERPALRRKGPSPS